MSDLSDRSRDLLARAHGLLNDAFDPRYCYCPFPRCGNRHLRGPGEPPPIMVSTVNTVPDPPNGHGGHACPDCGHKHLLPIPRSQTP